MKSNNKAIITLAVIVMTVVLTGCFPTDRQKKIYNDEDKIAENSNSYTYGLRIDNADDKNNIDIKYTAFTGDDTIWCIEGKEGEEIMIDFDSTLEKGDFKVVLVTSKKEVTTIFEGEKKDKQTIALEKGENLIKIVGFQGKGKIKMSITGNENIKISKPS